MVTHQKSNTGTNWITPKLKNLQYQGNKHSNQCQQHIYKTFELKMKLFTQFLVAAPVVAKQKLSFNTKPKFFPLPPSFWCQHFHLSCLWINTAMPREVWAIFSTLFKNDCRPRYCWTYGKTTHVKSNRSHLEPLQAWHATEVPFLYCTDVVNIREEEKCGLPYCWQLFTFSSFAKFRLSITSFY